MAVFELIDLMVFSLLSCVVRIKLRLGCRESCESNSGADCSSYNKKIAESDG